MSAREIAEAAEVLEISWRNVFQSLTKLLDQHEIKCIEINNHQALKHFGSKRKLRIYYLDKKTIQKRKELFE